MIDRGIDGNNIQIGVKGNMGGCTLDSSGSGKGPVTGNEYSG